jgi:CRISPR-associated endonuclease/helicase Cas3
LGSEYHDDGKQHPKWLSACRKEYEIFLQTGKVDGTYMQKTGIRHEMESLYLNQNKALSDVVKVAIAAHHGKLSKRFEERWEKDDGGKYRSIWESFIALQNSLSPVLAKKKVKFHRAIIENYKFAGVRSYLQLADHRASIKEDNKFVPEFTKFSYTFNSSWAKRPVQEIAEKCWHDDLLLLRAPTGAGKTDACLLWAQKQIENNRADRLVIAMPTRFTSNALAINVAESLSKAGLYHSSAWFTKYFENAKTSFAANHKATVEHQFARLLETPVTVCTIDHLLIALTHTREDHHSITFNLANSCLVIDEADFYDEFTQANILILLKALKILDVPVLLMSASLPQSSLELYQQTGYQVSEIKEDTSDNRRQRCKVNSIRKYYTVSQVDPLLQKAKKQPTIIYANTVAKAMEFYNTFSLEEQKQVTLYHSRFTEPDKAKKESELLQKLGKEAWKNGNAQGVAIMTQIGEMSVNISANYMISDICPIDRLIQRIGRLARFDNTIGLLEVLIPYQGQDIYPAPYGNYIKGDGWEVSKALIDSINCLERKTYNAFEFVDLVNKVYPNIPGFSNTTLNNIDAYKEQVINNWLIMPYTQKDEDDISAYTWKSRNIEDQVEVLVLSPQEYLSENEQKLRGNQQYLDKNCFFDNYREYSYYKTQYAVTCSPYLLQKAEKQGKVYKSDDIWVGDSKTPLNVWLTNDYNSNTGLGF